MIESTAYKMSKDDIRCIKIFRKNKDKLKTPFQNCEMKLNEVYTTDKVGFHLYPYASLESIRKMINKSINKNGLVIVEIIIPKNSYYVAGTDSICVNTNGKESGYRLYKYHAFASKTIKLIQIL